MDWYLKVVRDNYANFQGRAQRKEYWMFILFNVIITAILGIIDSALSASLTVGQGEIGILGALYGLAVLVPGLAVSVRRLHDTGRMGWWILIALIPFIGGLVLLIFMVLDSEQNENQYGPNPKGASAGMASEAPAEAPKEDQNTPQP